MDCFDENIFFRQATLRLCGSLDLNVALGNLLPYLKGFLPVSAIALGLYDPEKFIVYNTAWAAVDENYQFPDSLVIPKHFQPKAKNIWDRLEHGQPMLINDFDKEDPMLKEVNYQLWPGDCSVMAMTFSLDGRRIGGFDMWAKGKNQYTKFHAYVMSLLLEPFAIALSNALTHLEVLKFQEMLADDNQYLREQLLHISGDMIIGAKAGLKGVMQMVHQVAQTDSPVLLLGETGVGKEVIANALHKHSRRKAGPIITINCGAIPETLIDSELFGHEKGAYTGATVQKRGRFERAHKGTIFLDEIGELPLQAQVRLLRVLQTKEIERVGGSSYVPVDVRIICATNQNLEEMVKAGLFRADLFFRLYVFPIFIPPLRERKKDIPSLVHHFVEKKSRELKIHPVPVMDQETLDRLTEYRWPGNVRELENFVERSLIQCRGLKRVDLLRFENPGKPIIKKDEVAPQETNLMGLDEMNRYHIKQAMELSKGRVEGPKGAARILKVHPNTLRYKMKKLGISFGRAR